MKLELSKIRTDGGTQSRANLKRTTINEYAESIHDGIELPPLDVFYDGENYWLADGFHRYWAKKQLAENTEDSFLPEETIEVTVHQGTQRDAILFSLGANATHGLPRTQEDKNRAVETIIRDSEWTNWSDREIARICKVSNTFVAKCREKINGSTVNVDSKTYKRDGKVQTMKTENIGKHKITKEKEAVDIETGEIIIKNENTLQLEESIEKEIEDAQNEQFNQDVELPPYNVISEKGKILDLRNREDVIEILAESELRNTKEKLNKVEQELQNLKQLNTIDFIKEIAGLIGLNLYEIIPANQEILDKLKESMALKDKVTTLESSKNKAYKELAELSLTNGKQKIELEVRQKMIDELSNRNAEANEKIAKLTETNNQLFLANENLTKELNEIKQKNVDFENKLSEIRAINNNTIELEQKNKNLEYQINTLTKENETLKEANSTLKNHAKPKNSNQSDEMLSNIQSILEVSLEKGKEKGEGIRIGRRNSLELLDAIKQARGIE